MSGNAKQRRRKRREGLRAVHRAKLAAARALAAKKGEAK